MLPTTRLLLSRSTRVMHRRRFCVGHAQNQALKAPTHFVNRCGLEFAAFAKQVSFRGTKVSIEIANVPSQTNSRIRFVAESSLYPTGVPTNHNHKPRLACGCDWRVTLNPWSGICSFCCVTFGETQQALVVRVLRQCNVVQRAVLVATKCPCADFQLGGFGKQLTATYLASYY